MGNRALSDFRIRKVVQGSARFAHARGQAKSVSLSLAFYEKDPLPPMTRRRGILVVSSYGQVLGCEF